MCVCVSRFNFLKETKAEECVAPEKKKKSPGELMAEGTGAGKPFGSSTSD